MTRPVTDGLYGRIIRIMLLWKTVDFKNTFSRAVASGGRGGGRKELGGSCSPSDPTKSL